jgi:hypothetical protein
MTQKPPQPNQRPASEFEREAGAAHTGIVSEVLAFLAENKKWWLTPIVLMLLLLGLLIVIGGTGAAPFIYTLF